MDVTNTPSDAWSAGKNALSILLARTESRQRISSILSLIRPIFPRPSARSPRTTRTNGRWTPCGFVDRSTIGQSLAVARAVGDSRNRTGFNSIISKANPWSQSLGTGASSVWPQASVVGRQTRHRMKAHPKTALPCILLPHFASGFRCAGIYSFHCNFLL